MTDSPMDLLLTLPPAMAQAYAPSPSSAFADAFATCDPAGSRLGSGGGTAHLLAAAFAAQSMKNTFGHWLRGSRKLILHGGGQSRRLPSYAPIGKPLIPIPIDQSRFGQRLDQTLLDFQLPIYARVLGQAPANIVAMITSGDVLLRFGESLPPFLEADIIALGMRVSPEVAQHFGVFFLAHSKPDELAFFLQKPESGHIRNLSETYHFLVDTGMWLLSERAVQTLLQKCGWNAAEERFVGGLPGNYELYAEFGLSLGSQAQSPDPAINALTCAVVALPEPEFYHLGTSRQLLEAVSRLQEGGTNTRHYGIAAEVHQFVLNAEAEAELRTNNLDNLWIENATVGAGWRLSGDHILTGIPANDWNLTLEPGVCLDFVPIGEQAYAVRTYGIDDAFKGELRHADTLWLGRPVTDWFANRGLDWESAGIAPETDIQQAPLFPVLTPGELDSDFLTWLLASEPSASSFNTTLWRSLPRLSAHDLGNCANISRLTAQRRQHRLQAARKKYHEKNSDFFSRLDLEATAQELASNEVELSAGLPPSAPALARMHDFMFRSAVARHRQQPDWKGQEDEAFACLRQNLIAEAQLSPVHPRCCVLEDQIVWARSPVRLDLAGGWTDTPPYCLEHGGQVVNLAVNLNGQPPVQVFVKRSPRFDIVIRSIDLGVEDRVQTYEELDTFARAGSEFALAKAALAMCGFLPRFHAEGGFGTLERHLQEFGSGIEISMVAAVPAGSGLGTSSVLAATLLGALNELCGLNWDRFVLLRRTLVVEQMLTTGGGWQDQAGGVFRGIKLLETTPGLTQNPSVRWLPEHLFDGYANSLNLLYYTGLTRMAKNILHEIVRGMFLNSANTLDIVQAIGENAFTTFDAVQRADRDGLCQAVRRSWDLNQRLDAGTNTSGVQAILDTVGDTIAGAKLLGAGGGGYLLMLAKDEAAVARVRKRLLENPPNVKARFVDFSLSHTGLEITRS